MLANSDTNFRADQIKSCYYMQEERAASTIEKQEVGLLDLYHKCLEMMYTGSIDQGIHGLKALLQNPIVHNKEFGELRFSIYQSLAELSEKHSGQLTEAVYYLHQALKIRESFMEWKRLASLCRRRGFLEQAHFSLKKAIAMAPVLHRDILLEELCEVYVLSQNQREAIEIADQLIAKKFRIARAKSLKLAAVQSLLGKAEVEMFTKKRLVLQEDMLLAEGTQADTAIARERIELETRNEGQEQRMQSTPQADQPSAKKPVVPFLLKQDSSWANLLAKLYLVLKYSSSREEEKEKRKKNTRVYKQLDEFFTGKQLLREPLKVCVVSTSPPNEQAFGQDNQRLDNLAESYLTLKRKKHKEAGPITKMASSEPDRQLVRITGNINIKDHLSNPAVHINSLLHLQCKHKRKDMSKLQVMRQLSDELCPAMEYYPSLFNRLQERVEMVEVMELDRSGNEKTNTSVEVAELEEEKLSSHNVEGEQLPQEAHKQARRASEAQKQSDQYLHDDYLQFIRGIDGQCLISIFELVRRVVLHFVRNQPKSLQLAEATSKDPYQQSLDYTPNYFLKSLQYPHIKHFVKRLFIQSTRLCSGDLYPEMDSKVTLLELSVERYVELNNKSLQGKNKDRLDNLRKKKSQLHTQIIGLEGELFLKREFAQYMESQSDKVKTLLKMRVYHCLAIYFSLPDQENPAMLDKLLAKFKLYQQQHKGRTDDLSINLFWLDMGSTKTDLQDYVEHRLKENRLQSQLELREVGRAEQMINTLRNSLQNFRRAKEKSAGEAVDLYYKNIIEMISDELLPFTPFLSNLCEILALYLQILQKKPNREDYSRFISKVDDLMKIEELVQQLCKRVNQEKEVHSLQQFVRLSNLFLRIVLVKFFIQENENHNNSNLIKGLSVSISSLIRGMTAQQRNKFIPDLVLLMHMLAHVPNDNISVHRKINTHFMSKFIDYLYDDKRMELEDESASEGKEKSADREKNLEVISMDSEEKGCEQQREQTSFRDDCEEVLKCYYGFSQRKLSEFAPSTYEQIEGFTRYLKIWHPRYFQEPSSKIKIPICNILRAAEEILLEEKSKFCEGLDEARKKLSDFYVKNQRDEEFFGKMVMIMNGAEGVRLCDCGSINCFGEMKGRASLIDTYYIVGRSLENDQFTDNDNYKDEIEKNYRHAQRLYQTLVCLDVSQGRSWYCLFKINKKKAYVNFDYLIYDEQPAEVKGSFLSAKKLAFFMKDQPKLLFAQVRGQLEEDLFILNLLKIYERKLCYLQSRETTPHDSEAVRNRQSKLKDAEQTIMSKLEGRSLRVQYLSLVYLIRPYEMHYNFNSATCMSLVRQFTQLREAVLHNEESEAEECKLTDEDTYPEMLYLILKIVARYIELIKSDNQASRLVWSDFVDWFEGVRGLIPELLGERGTVENYYETYMKKDPTTQDARDRSWENQGYLASVVSYRQASSRQEPLVSAAAVISGVNLMIGNVQQHLRDFLAKPHNKKSKLMRNYTTCCYQLSRFQLQFEGRSEQAVSTMGELVNIKYDDIIQVYRYYESQSLERDPKLGEFFNRNLYYMLCKFKYIKYVLELYFEISEYTKIQTLYKKLTKLHNQSEVGRINQVFSLLHKISLEMSINSLWEMLVSKDCTEEFQKWILELYEKIIKPKKKEQGEHAKIIRNIIAAHYVQKERQRTPNKEIPEAGRFEKGLALLQEKHKKKKAKQGQAQAKKGVAPLPQ